MLGMQDSLRSAGSHLYRLAPLLLELARAFSGAVAAMQGHAGPLALNGSAYIRPDGQSLGGILSLTAHIALHTLQDLMLLHLLWIAACQSVLH